MAKTDDFEPDFVDEPSQDFTCPICLSAVNEPQLTQCCGHHFCLMCIERLQKAKDPCPMCKSTNISYCYDKFFERKVKELKVRCPRSEDGCNWIGELGDQKRHEQTCPEVRVNCTCGAQVHRKNIEQHVGENIQKHLLILQSKLSNKDEEIAALKKATVSLNQSCSKAHTKIKVLEQTHSDTQAKLQEATDKISVLERRLVTFIPPPQFVMEEFERHKRKDDSWFSPPFYSHIEGYKLCIGVRANGRGDGAGRYVSLFVHLMMGDNDADLRWPFHGQIMVQLINQRSEEDHLEEVVTFDDKVPDSHRNRVLGCQRARNGWGFMRFISHAELAYNDTKTFLKNDCLKFRITKIRVVN